MIPSRRAAGPGRWLTGALTRAFVPAPAAVALALVAGWPYFSSHPLAAAVTLLSCGAFAAAGGLLTTAAPSRASGVLLLVAALAWAVNWSASWDRGVWPLVSAFAQATFYLAVGLSVLIYPAGRLTATVDRAWALQALVILWGGQVAICTTSRPEWSGFRPGTLWLTVSARRAVFHEVLQVMTVAYALLAASLALALLLRLPRMGRLDRALAVPVMVAIAFVGISAAITEQSVMEDVIRLPELLHVYVLQGAFSLAVPAALLATALRSRFRELAAAARTLHLTDYPSVERVQSALRDVLHDPTLQVWFWIPPQNVYADDAGRPLDLDAGVPQDSTAAGRWRRTVDRADGPPLAVVDCDARLQAHASLVEAALVAAGRALETAQLQAVVQAQLEQVRSAQERLVRAEAAERERLARDLHDGAQQRLLALGVNLGILENTVHDAALRPRLRECRLELLECLGDLRALARGIHPAVLVQEGIAAAIEPVAERLGIRVHLHATRRRFSRDVESTMYFALCEALSNVVKHAQATEIRINVTDDTTHVTGVVHDDGTGGACTSPGGGLAGINDRVGALRGRIELSSPLGAGTTVKVVLPCA
ncbi:sensor histidine kinase [Streptomyces sp. NPDC058954]|uniref:sensor histidine kinase n=1 Tax=Streptomyces sp. NPDC058954 TaxID=3346677 RepID=UPI00368956A4